MYDKKFIEVGDYLKKYLNDRENRVEESFDNVDDNLSSLSSTVSTLGDNLESSKTNIMGEISKIRDDFKPVIIELLPESGWSNVSGYGRVRAKKVNNNVYLFGMISGGTSDTIFTLPNDIRPTDTHRGVALVGSGTTYVTIRPNGIVTATNAAGRSNLSLSGIVYSLD